MKVNLLCLVFSVLFIHFSDGFSQKRVPVIKTKSKVASLRIGKQYYPNAWEITPKPANDPENINFNAPDTTTQVSIITDSDSIGFAANQGDLIPFIVLINGKDSAFAQIRAAYPKAHFTEAYKKQYDGKTLIEVPKVYELVNIIMALTPTGIRDSALVEHETPYYRQVLAHFSPFKNDPAVRVMDSLLKADRYYDIKMDGYSYELDAKGKLQKSQVYRYINWGNKNQIEPYIPAIQAFASKSNFLSFYKKHEPFYASLIRAYRDSLAVPVMQSWLNKNFPTTRYNCFKIIFSPLVNANQSTVSFENNGFSEGHPHVDFPYSSYFTSLTNVSAAGINVRRGNILFTELNHLFENPELEGKSENSKRLEDFSFNLDVYGDKAKAASSYWNQWSMIEEYMNWALVSLRYIDYAPKEDLPALFDQVDNFMVSRRGFKKFKAFNHFLIDAYQARPSGKVVADLYPQILTWFKENNQ